VAEKMWQEEEKEQLKFFLAIASEKSICFGDPIEQAAKAVEDILIKDVKNHNIPLHAPSHSQPTQSKQAVEKEQ
jgi:hypothetical protein